MNRIDQLEEMLANRRFARDFRFDSDDRKDERMAFDSLPELLAVVRAVQNTDTRCLFRYRPDPCGSCVMCILHAALAPLMAPQSCQHVYHTVGSNSVCRFCDRLEFCGSETCACAKKRDAPAVEPAPVQCLDAQERDKLNEAEDRVHQSACTAAWDELEALLDANEQRHKLAAEDPWRIPEGHDFEAKQWATVRRLLSLSCGDEPAGDGPGNPTDPP